MNNHNNINPIATAAVEFWEDFFEQTIHKERIKEDKIKKSLKRFIKHEPHNMSTNKKFQ